jgi:hypothetical protein
MSVTCDHCGHGVVGAQYPEGTCDRCETRIEIEELKADRDRWEKHANDLGDLLAKREDEIARLRAEPPIDGDRHISLKAAIEALQSQLDAMPQSVTTDTKGHLKREMDFEQGARGCLMHNIEILKSLGAAEPPSAPRPCYCGQTLLPYPEARLDDTEELGCYHTADICKPDTERRVRLHQYTLVEPPSAPAPCPTNHGNGLWQKRIGNLRELRFCPDCGAKLRDDS